MVLLTISFFKRQGVKNMILDINRSMNGFVNFLGEPINHVMHGAGNLASRVINQLHQNHSVAAVVCVVSNYAILSLIQNFAESIHQGTEKYFENLTEKQKILKNLLLKGAVVGGSAAVFNTLLSTVTQHPLSRHVVAALVIGTIALRAILKEGMIRYHEYLDVKKALASAQSIIETMKANESKRSLEKEILEIESSKDEVQIEIDTLTGSLKEANKKIKALQAELEKSEKAIPNQSDVEIKEKAFKDIQSQFEEAQSQIVLLKKALKEAHEKIDALSKNLDDEVIPLSDSETEVLFSKDSLIQFHVEEGVKLKSDIEGLNKQIEALSQELTALKSEKEQGEVGGGTDELTATLQQENKALRDQLAALRDSSAEKNNQKNGEIKGLILELQAKNKEIVEVKQILNQLKRLLPSDVRSKGEDSETESDSDVKDLPYLAEQFQQFAADKDQLAKDLQALRAEKKDLAEKLTAALQANAAGAKDQHGKDKEKERRSSFAKIASFTMGSATKPSAEK